MYFFGDVVEKLGPKKYQITGGGFSTCVQPTPRWELHASTVLLNIDHYTMLRNAIFRVKNVPLMYLPILYYPTKEENRATGFLLPTYGTSTVDGQIFSNAFFWAIDRSQDATVMHDWYSKTGQGLAGEYRYNFGGGSDGSLRSYLKDGRQATYTTPDGLATTQPSSRYYEIAGGANHDAPGQDARPRLRGLLLQRDHDADASQQRVRRVAQQPPVRRQRHRRPGASTR